MPTTASEPAWRACRSKSCSTPSPTSCRSYTASVSHVAFDPGHDAIALVQDDPAAVFRALAVRLDQASRPRAALDYLQYIADFVKVPIALIGIGPSRDQVIWTEAGRDMYGSGLRTAA